MAACQTIPGTDALPSGLIAFFDCQAQAQALGAGGYGALAAPGSTAQGLLTALLTILVALIGIRLVLGEVLGLRDGVFAALRVGFVLALAVSWPAYRTLVYDVVLLAPAELAARIGAPSGLPGSAGDLASRLDTADRAFDALAIAGVGLPLADQPGVRTVPQPFVGFDTFAVGMARFVFLAGALGAFAFLRLGAGLLLALGPLFVGFLLFEGTRGLVEGWLRGLVGTALGALATSIVLGVELSLFEPCLYDLLARRAALQSIQGAPGPLLAVSLVFAVALAALLLLAFRVAAGLRFPRGGVATVPASERQAGAAATGSRTAILSTGSEERSRALAVADAIMASQRRENGYGERGVPGIARAARIAEAPGSAARGGMAEGFGVRAPLGHQAMRRTVNRHSASAARRDRRS